MGVLDYSILTVIGVMLLTLLYQLFFAKRKRKTLIYVLSSLLLIMAWINFSPLILPPQVSPMDKAIFLEPGSKEWEEDMQIHERVLQREMNKVSKDDPKYQELKKSFNRLQQERKKIELEKNSK